jgi:para-nitrobenzyl esterase
MTMLRKDSFGFLGLILALTMILMIPIAAAKNNNDGEFTNQLEDPILTDAGYVSGTLVDTLLVTNGNPQGPVSSVRVGNIGEAVRYYRGIPYAAPPVGNLRFKPPQPVTPWSGIREATAFSKWPPQAFPSQTRLGYLMDDSMSEDCLYLNVITPAKRKNERLPVLVWLHGGGLTTQSGTRAGYNMPAQAQQGAVTVSVSGRLDVMGFLAHPALSAESPMGASGNYGMLDLVAALKWVKKNIAAFGGDPDRIMIWGQSGGGSKINWLMTSPLTTGLFDSAICQSGGGGGLPLATMEQRGVALFTKLGISTLEELRALPWQDIQLAAGGGGFSTSPTIDGWSMIDTVQNVFAAGKQQNVPFIIGIAHTEWTPTNFTVNLMKTLKSSGSPTYVFVHTHMPPGWKPAKAWHSFENGYIFHAIRAVAPNNFNDYARSAGAPYSIGPGSGLTDAGWTYGRDLRYECGPSQWTGVTITDAEWNWLDAWHEDFMSKTWIKFAATGNPNLHKGTLEGPRLPTWLPYDYAVDQFMALDSPPVVEPGFTTPPAGGVLPIPIPVWATPFPPYSGPPPF